MTFSYKAVLFSLFFVSSVAVGQTLYTNFPVVDGVVNAMAQDSATIYLGGSFTYAGPPAGHGVVLDLTTGSYSPGFPNVNGAVYVCITDNNGGWYIGGQFTKVGSTLRNFVARIKPNGTVDAWNPNPDSEVHAIALYGSKVYLGGLFTHVAGVARTYAAAVDTVTGSVSSWNPNPDSGPINAITVASSGSLVYIGGYFSKVKANSSNPIPRTNVAAVDTATGDTTGTGSWNPGVSATTPGVYGMLLGDHDSTLYVWGNVSAIAGTTRRGVGAVQTYSNTATSWNPNAYKSTFVSGSVYALAVSGDTVFLGGLFVKMYNTSTTRNFLAAVNRTGTGTLLSWNPNIAAVWPYSGVTQIYPPGIYSIAVSGNVVYVGGAFNSVAGVTRSNLAAIDRSTGLATSWDPHASDGYKGKARALAFSGNNLYAGGEFVSVNGGTRHGLVAIDKASRTVTSWNPALGVTDATTEPDVASLEQYGSTLFAAGYFESVGAQTVRNFAAISKTTGLYTAFPALTATYGSASYYLKICLNKLYISGPFTTLGNYARNNVGCVDLTNDSVTAWYPRINLSSYDTRIYALAVSGSTVYFGGNFDSVGTAVREGLAAVDDSLGNATSWNPNAGSTYSQGASSMQISGSTIYVGGSFAVGSITRNGIAAIDAVTGAYTAWNPNITGTPVVDAIAMNGSTMYVGGLFSLIGATSRTNVATIDTSTGAATSWNPAADNYVYALLVDSPNHKIYLGGSFSTVLGQTASCFAVVDNPGDAALPVELVSLTGTVSNQSNVELHWTTATEVDNYGFDIERRMLGGNTAAAWMKVGFVHGVGTSASPHDYAFSDRQVHAGRYGYRIRQIDNAGSSKYTHAIEIEIGSVPQRFTLSQNFPNPFNPTTVIEFSIPARPAGGSKLAIAKLQIFDLLGREMATLVNEQKPAGTYQVTFDASHLPSGIYFARLQAGNEIQTRKLSLIK